MNFKQFAQISRWQTFPATWILFFTPYLVAGGELLSLESLILSILIWLIHGSTFAHNVVSDYEMDKNDSSKQDHPLTSGDIGYGKAVRTFAPYLFLVELGCLAVSVWLAPKIWPALLFIFLMIAGGHYYNDWSYSSRSKLAFIPISICWTALAGWGWFLADSGFNLLIFLILGYALFRIWFQISVSGRLKEMGVESEANELKWMGAKISDGMFKPHYAYSYAMGLSWLEIGTGVGLIMLFNLNIVSSAIALILMGGGFVLTYKMIRKAEWSREDQLKRMSLIEILFIYALPVMFVGTHIWLPEALILLVGGVLYFYGMNKYLWKHGSHPGV